MPPPAPNTVARPTTLGACQPWQWVATRVLAGAILVFGVTALVARVVPADLPASAAPAAAGERDALRPAPVRYVRVLARLAIVLVPENALVLFAVGVLRGWLFPLDGGLLDTAVLGAAVAGTLVVIPTAGEIPIPTAWPRRAPEPGSSGRCSSCCRPSACRRW